MEVSSSGLNMVSSIVRFPSRLLVVALLIPLLSYSSYIVVAAADNGAGVASPDAPSAPSLRDYPIAADSITYLDGEWTASSSDGEYHITGQVPGDLISDLFRNKIIPEPIYELNWLKNASVWNKKEWTYKTVFSLSADAIANGAEILLVFDGIKMASTISVNGVQVAKTTDQFLRHIVPLKASGVSLLDDANTVEVTFDPLVDCNGRFMACTGGWDWAPYSNTDQPSVGTPGTAHTFSKGIWKSVYTAVVSTATITHFVPHVYYTGPFPTEPLVDGNHAPFVVKATVHMWAPAATSGFVTVSGSWGQEASTPVNVPMGESNVTLSVDASADEIKLWWPAGVGAHPLFPVTAKFTPASLPDSQAQALEVSTSRSVGFRFFALVTGNDTDPAYVAANRNVDGTDSMGMRFRVNGAPIYARGANMIPMDELEGRLDPVAVVRLVKSAAEGGMNILRVWGGGVFQPTLWYETCDQEGILVYHDMQYAQEGHSPMVSETQEAEFRHQVRRLSHHPSIAIWDGCNECVVKIGTPTGIYATFVLKTVVEEDKSRVVWPSCPAAGWSSGVNRLSSLPNGSPHGLVPAVISTPIEVHGPYQHGNGWPAVNGATELELFTPYTPISLKPVETGLGIPNQFTSETGAITFPSFESISPFLDASHWGLHAGMPPDNCTGSFTRTCSGDNPMAQRNYPCDNFLITYFNVSAASLDKTGEEVFKTQLYQCMLGQALLMKGSMELHRATNQFGTMIWQFNEIWPTGGWGTIEYGTASVPGQVRGGRWKPLHYWLRNNAFADLMSTCGEGGQCVVKNDQPGKPFSGNVKVEAVSLSDGSVSTLASKSLDMPSGPGITDWFSFDASSIDGQNQILTSTVSDSSGAVQSHNILAFDIPHNLKVMPSGASATVATTPNSDGSVNITIAVNHVAVYVVLTTQAHGRFGDNAFIAVPPSKVVPFYPFGDLDMALLKSTLRVEDLSMRQ